MRVFGLEISRARPPAPVRAEPVLSAPAVASVGSADPTAVTQLGWGNVRGGSSVKGLPRVTPEAGANHATVLTCCTNIAGDLAKVPLKLWQRGSGGLDARVRNHPLVDLLNGEAAPGVPGKLVRFAAVYGYTLRGNGYIFGPRDGGGELMRLDIVQTAELLRSEGGLDRFYEFEDGAGVQRRVPHRSMAHLRYMALDGWTGRSPLQVAAESVGIALAGQAAAARNAVGGSAKGVIKLGDYYDSDEQRELNAKRIKGYMTDPGGDGWVVTNPEEEVKTLDMSAADQELLASRKFDREMLAALYRMPPSKLQMLEYGVKANGEQQAIDYLTDCLFHWSALAEAQLQVALLTKGERDRGLYLKHDFAALLQPTYKDQVDALTKAVGGPIVRPNEGREKLGLVPVPEGNLLNPAPNMTRDAGAGETKDKGAEE